MIRIHKANELFLRLEADRTILLEIYENFSFFVPGYKHMPKFKDGLWDGQIHLFQLKQSLFPYGLLADLFSFCKRNKYQVEVVNREQFRTCVSSQDDINELLLNRLPSLTKYQLSGKYEYQLDAVLKCITLTKTIVLSPTGSGKSHVIYLLVRYLLDFIEEDILIIVPTTNLVEQMYGDFKSYINDGFDLAANCSSLYSGKDKNERKRILISTWQSIFKLDVDFFSRFGVVICDEAHLANSASIKGIVTKMPHACFRYGFTGTLNGSKCHEMELKAMFGPVYKAQTTKELQDEGVLSPVHIDAYIIDYPEVDRRAFSDYLKQNKGADAAKKYQNEMKWIVLNSFRNSFIANTALQQTGNTLILFNFVDRHGKVLFDLLKSLDSNKKIYYISGSTKIGHREEVRQIAESQNDVIIVASSSVFSTGTNIKNLEVLIFAHPYKTRIRNLQSIGRILRLSSQKTTAKVIDIIDDLTYNRKKNICYNHGLERLELYDSEGFEYKIHKIKAEST